MKQAPANRIDSDVAALPMSQREAIWKDMEGRKDLANLASGNPDMTMPRPVCRAMQDHVDEGYARYSDYYGINGHDEVIRPRDHELDNRQEAQSFIQQVSNRSNKNFTNLKNIGGGR